MRLNCLLAIIENARLCLALILCVCTYGCMYLFVHVCAPTTPPPPPPMICTNYVHCVNCLQYVYVRVQCTFVHRASGVWTVTASRSTEPAVPIDTPLSLATSRCAHSRPTTMPLSLSAPPPEGMKSGAPLRARGA